MGSVLKVSQRKVVYATKTKISPATQISNIVTKNINNFMDRMAMLREMLADYPADSFLQHAMALELIKAGDDTAARKTFEALLEANPDYVGSYYHLGKLFERNGDSMQALEWYEKGMEVARSVGDMHAFGELRAAADNLDG